MEEFDDFEFDVILNEKNVIKCPECGNESLIINGRCATCPICGYSLCSM